MTQRTISQMWVSMSSITILALALVAFSVSPAMAQVPDYPGFRVEGHHLYDRFGDRVVLVGVNKMVIWTDRDGMPSFSEIAKTGANTVRIVWLTDGSAEELDLAITNAINHQLIPMIDCHDSTGEWDMLQTCVDYWVRPDVLGVIKKHQEYLLVNVANECGQGVAYEWEFKAAYELAIRRMRAAGIHVPLIIDAQGFGQNIDDLQLNGPYLIEADPDHNLMFSIHMWWPTEWRGAQVAQMVIDEIEESVAMELPLIVGEFASKGPGCSCCIPYQTIIETCHEYDVGYLPWSWGPGNQDCAEMDMTEDGTLDTLHGWGLEVAITSPHSIKNIAVRPDWIVDRSPVAASTPVPTATPQPVPEGVISQGQPVRTSSDEGDTLTGANVVDGDSNTRWSSAWQNDEYITIDLGDVQDMARVVLDWETAYGSEYKVQVSSDGETWEDVVHVTDGDGGRDDHTVSATGRYVRMLGLKRATEWGFSLWEFWILDRADVTLPEREAEDDASAGGDEVVAIEGPDLIVSELGWAKSPPVKDEGVIFTATLANRGQHATSDGEPVRCVFMVRGTLVSWATYDDVVYPGQSVQVEASAGPDGNAIWEPDDTGPFVVLAWVDAPDSDASRSDGIGAIPENDEHNNMLTAFDYVRLNAPTPTATATPKPTMTPTATPTVPPLPTVAPETSMSESGPSIPPFVWWGGGIGLILVGVIFVVIRLKRASTG